jgi:hypothetical protein
MCPLQLRDLLDVTLVVKLSAGTGERHILHLSEHRTLESWAVVLAYDCPRNAGITIRIASVQFVPIIQPDCQGGYREML